MKIKKGDVLNCPGMVLRVVDVRGRYVKCEYLNSDGEWKPRAVTENRARLEAEISSGTISIAE